MIKPYKKPYEKLGINLPRSFEKSPPAWTGGLGERYPLPLPP